MNRYAALALLGLVACNQDYNVQGRTDPPNLDDTSDPVIDPDPEPPGDRPIAVCEVASDTVQPPFEQARFMGGNSYDPAGSPITRWVWTLAARPDGSAISLGTDASQPDRVFTPDLGGTYTGRLVVTTDDGRSSEPCEVSLEGIPGQDFWVEMYWTYADDDMDLHLLAPGGTLRGNEDCYYGNTNPEWGGPSSEDDPALDLDDIPGTGPENINIGSPEPGTFKVVVNDYTGSTPDYYAGNPTTVNIYVGGILTWSDTRTITGEGDDIYFAKVSWPGGDVTSCADSGC